MNLADIKHLAPAAFAEQPHEAVSEGYQFVPTSTILERLYQEGFTAFEVKQTKAKLADRQGTNKHLIRLRHANAPSLPGGAVPEIILVNSHNTSSAYQIRAGVYRFVCANGLVIGDELAAVKVAHIGRDVADKVIEGSYRIIEESDKIGARIEKFSRVTLSATDQVLLAHRAAELRWGKDKVENLLAPITPQKLLLPRRSEDIGSDAWKVLNRIQENVIRGGQTGRAQTGRRLRTSSVNAIDDNLRINAGLWAYAEELVGV